MCSGGLLARRAFHGPHSANRPTFHAMVTRFWMYHGVHPEIAGQGDRFRSRTIEQSPIHDVLH